ncbi:hypothetical protein [Candidatus Frankia nodulisporulans]|uniref:hypothetical protein n=1 Tax=Candidatus Frankia nodulisporulans TaxID=2060052 RepID=UPI0037037E0E
MGGRVREPLVAVVDLAGDPVGGPPYRCRPLPDGEPARGQIEDCVGGQARR